jgi:DNA-binding MarR family transcriptional regulator
MTVSEKTCPSALPTSEPEVLEQLNALMFVFRGQLHRLVRESGLPLNPMEVKALLHIAHHPGSTAGDLARHSGRDKAQVTRLVQQLEEQGLLTRQPDAQDRRVQRLHVTEAGQALHARLRRERDALSQRMLASLSQAEQAQLAALLAKLRQGQGGEPLQTEG